jgi:hypothetical protein
MSKLGIFSEMVFSIDIMIVRQRLNYNCKLVQQKGLSYFIQSIE